MEHSRKKLWVMRGFCGFGLWAMKFLNILVFVIKKVVKYDGFP
jgi:NO-binding membrane sensor protein with MHYT domain